MIPSPNLDDRTFKELVEEAKRLIPQYCPEWTNFNASDPGITLLELYAWMTELMLYRLNKVPEKNYLAFLELMGVRLEPPRAAEAILCFTPSATAGTIEIPMLTGAFTRAEGGARPIPFETTENLTVVNNHIGRVVTQVRQSEQGKTLIEDVSELANGEQEGGFSAFQGTRVVERFLYLGDDRLVNFTEEAVLSVSIERNEEFTRPLRDLLEWEYFDGAGWRPLSESQMGPREGVQVFDGPSSVSPVDVYGVESHWIRARLIEVPSTADETMINTVRGKLEVLGEGVSPDRLYANVVDDIYLNRDPDKHFLPFDREPRIDSTFYIRCDSILSQEGNIVRIEADIADASYAETPAPSADMSLRWEFFNGKKWMLLGKSSAGGVSEKTPGRYGLVDGTYGFSRTGVIEFGRPSTLGMCPVNGEEGYWVRVRIEKGDFGVPGSYENVDDRWVWQDERPLRPPVLKRLMLKSTEEASPFSRVLTFNDWCYNDETSVAAMESQEFQAFHPVPEESPTLFIGFTDKFPETETQIYVRLVEDLDIGTDRDLEEQSVVWEFWDGKDWQSLLPRDETRGMTRSGFVRFKGPKSLKKSQKFGTDLYWVRARLEMGGYDLMPEVDRILLNAVPARNATTYKEAILGASQGTPNQVFAFPRGPVLKGQEILVREKDEPTGEERTILEGDFGQGGVTPDPDQSGHWLVKWKEVSNLFESGPRSRHYVKDIVTGEVSFGDGVHGMIPPKGKRNIIAAEYPVGGGTAGNVKPDSIRILKQSFSFIDSVTNPFPAVGGCDMESVENLKQRGPHLLKSRNRAVTAEDFEWLSMEASNSVARVKAMSNPDRMGEVSVIVVPRITSSGDIDFAVKPSPTPELLRRVARYLDERRLLTTMIKVVRPRYVDVSIDLKIVRTTTGPGDRVKREIDKNLRTFLHPLIGGRDGKGWPFGRSVYKVDLYHLVEEVEGVDFVDSVNLVNLERGDEAEQIRLDEDQLVHLVDVQITELAREQGV